MTGMNEQHYLPWSNSELETLVREMIARTAEGPKVDRKQLLTISTAAEQAEFAKDVSAIANTDDEYYQGHGFIIFGVSKSAELCGGITALEAKALDGTSATLTNILKTYIAPVPRVLAYGFTDPVVGSWGVLVIPPSSSQPHIFVKELSGRPARGDWFVRIGDITDKARPEDFVRVLESAVRRTVEPLREELREVRVELRNLKSSLPSVLHYLRAGSIIEDPPDQAPSQLSTTASEVIERELTSPRSRVESELIAESLHLASALHTGDDDIPWVFNDPSKESLRSILNNIESATEELARTYGVLTRLDRNHHYLDIAAQGILPISEQKYPSSAHNPMAIALRLYPVALILLSATAAAVSARDVSLVRGLLDVLLVLGPNRERVQPLVAVFSELYAAADVFKIAQGQNYRYPIARRIHDVVPRWLDDIIHGPRPLDCFYVAEFLLYLACLDAQAIPVPGNFVTDSEAHFPVSLFLRGQPNWVRPLFRGSLEELLASFDKSIAQSADTYGFMDYGFRANAALAWEVGMDHRKWAQVSRRGQ